MKHTLLVSNIQTLEYLTSVQLTLEAQFARGCSNMAPWPLTNAHSATRDLISKCGRSVYQYKYLTYSVAMSHVGSASVGNSSCQKTSASSFTQPSARLLRNARLKIHITLHKTDYVLRVSTGVC